MAIDLTKAVPPAPPGPAGPCGIAIFGGTGDLASRKLLPSIYELEHHRLLPPGFRIVGLGMDEIDSEEYRRRVAAAIREHARHRPVRAERLRSLISRVDFQHIRFEDFAELDQLAEHMADPQVEAATQGNWVFYLATPPDAVVGIVQHLHAAGLAKKPGSWRRVVVEKPFGTDLRSAVELNRVLVATFGEENVYRIDHYLGKETVQNILAFRFANAIFEPIWNNKMVDSVEITVAESLGVELRSAYYERAGALRDMVQNHLLQLLTLTAMEPPVGFFEKPVRDEKVKVLSAIPVFGPREVDRWVVRGQYTSGTLDGSRVRGYREEPGIAPDSTTETFVAARFEVDNWRWAGVPFYVRTGKRLPKRASELRVGFYRPPHLTFPKDATRKLEPNSVVIRIQPDEGISLRFGVKVPGEVTRIRSVDMDFMYAKWFRGESPDAYERLLLDCLHGDPTLFARVDEAERAWALIDPIEQRWKERPDSLHFYEAGSWGPAAASRIPRKEHRRWHNP